MPLVLPSPHLYQRPTTGQVAKSALVFGDSQTEFMGEELAKILRDDGFTVDVDVNRGFTSKKLLQRLEEIYDPGMPPEYVFIFAGGNDARKNKDFSESVKGLVEYANAIGSVRVFWVGPPPQTRIGDPSAAKSAFGLTRPEGDPYWFKSTPQREAYNDKLRSQVEQAGAVFLDVRNAGLGGEDQSGVVWPRQPDGVHTEGETAKQAASWIASQAMPSSAASKGSIMPLALGGAAVAAIAYFFLRSR